MTIEEAVIDRLYSDATVEAAVGNRIHQLILPQNPTLPSIRVQLIDEPEMYHLRGHHNVYRARVQTDVFESAGVVDAYDSVTALAAAVNDALRAEGPYEVPAGSPIEFQILATIRDSRRVMYEAEELKAIRILQDFIVFYRMT